MTPKQRLDYFSGMALQGLLSSADYDWAVDDEIVDEDIDDTFAKSVATSAVNIAKAMINKLDKENL